MSEICFDCLNEIFGGNEDVKNYVLSDDLELCENCGEYKIVVITRRDFRYYFDKFRWITYPIFIISFPIILLFAPLIRFIIRKKLEKEQAERKRKRKTNQNGD